MRKDFFLPKDTLTSASQFLKQRPAYIFHHMMKCGGTSINNILSQWFYLIYDYHKSVEIPEEYFNNRFDMDQISSDYCIAGHFHREGIFVHQRYPEIISRKDEIRCFTFIRQPLNFFVSFYYYSKNVGRMEATLQEFIENNKNLLAYYLGCDESDYKNVLDRYFFIGITEDLQESLNKFANLINKPKLKVPVLNNSYKDNQTSLLTIEFTDKFKKDNELDYAIYYYVKNKFDL